MAHQVTLEPSGHQFAAEDDQTLLEAALDAGIHLPYGCRNGACGACKAKVVAGEVDHGAALDHALTPEDRAQGLTLTCCSRPLSDITLECREASAEADIPVRMMPVRVESLVRAAPDVVVMKIRLPASERLQFLAGQYVEFLLKDGGRRAFSIANAPQEDRLLEFHLRLVPGGKFTEYAFGAMKEKEILRIEGPHGRFQLDEFSDRPIIFLAGGTGFAPVKSMVEYMLHNRIQRPTIIYWGARDRSGLYLNEQAERWAAEHPHIRYVPVLSEPSAADAWNGRTGLVHRAVLEDRSDLSAFQVYACGAPAMIEAAHRDFRAHGLPVEQFFSDAFTYAPR
ncbi:MAG TPA: CDP-6-deoxy-delta-3,4-glucoseen reductase [Rhodocyclaceae bacterium]